MLTGIEKKITDNGKDYLYRMNKLRKLAYKIWLFTKEFREFEHDTNNNPLIRELNADAMQFYMTFVMGGLVFAKSVSDIYTVENITKEQAIRAFGMWIDPSGAKESLEYGQWANGTEFNACEEQCLKMISAMSSKEYKKLKKQVIDEENNKTV